MVTQVVTPFILIPVKPLDEGKSRLASALDAPARRRLCGELFERTLGLAIAFAGKRCLVISRDPEVLRTARGEGLVTVDESGDDLSAALDEGRRALGDALADGLMILPTDLPRVEAADLAAVATTAAPVVLAPDRRHDGTNLLLLSGPFAQPFRFRYGVGSFAAHLAEARRLGADPAVVERPGLAFDLDEPEDLRHTAWGTDIFPLPPLRRGERVG